MGYPMAIAAYREDGLSSSTAIKGPCRAATTANITLSGEQIIDDIAIVDGDRVLVRAQTNAVENGIYIADTGAWRRAADFAGNRDVRKGTRVAVTDGTTYAETEFMVSTNNPIVVDTTAIAFSLGYAFAAVATIQALATQAAADAAAAEQAKDDAEAAAASAGASNPTGLCATFGGPLPTGWLDCDGSAVSRTTYADLFAYLVTNSGFSAQTFTVTIASPGVVTRASHGFEGGERVRLSTSGALPTGLDAATDYYVVYIDANTFYLASTFGGTPINTSGSQSGTHTYLQSYWGLGNGTTTFNLPLLRDAFVRGWGSAREIGTRQAEMIGPHTHLGTTGVESADHTHNLTSDGGRHGLNDANPGSSFYTSDGDTNGGHGGKTQATNGVSATHVHDFETDENAGTENIPANTALRWAVKT